MHFTAETALDFLEGRLVKDQEIFWRQHLEGCSECTRHYGLWRKLVLDLKGTHLESAPGQDLVKAARIFPHQPDGYGSRIRSVLAELVFDSFLQPAFAGDRGDSAAARQLLLRAEEFDIHIRIWGEKSRRQMLGQLLSRSGETRAHSAQFYLLCDGEKLESTVVDETGEFRFADVPEGDLSLRIDLPHLTVIGALSVREDQ